MDKEIKELLEKILEELSLLSVSTKADALKNFNSDFLNTENRRAMYELFNGENDAKSIATYVGFTPRAVSLFIQDLQKNDLISFHKEGNSIIPEKSVPKIAIYYNKKKLEVKSND